MTSRKYYVIGGQYENYCYGSTDSLKAAKRIAAQNEEYWDNWQGWHRPQIWEAQNVYIEEDGEPAPKWPAVPLLVWNGKRWTDPRENW